MGLLAVALTLAVATGCGDDDDTAGPDDGTTTTEAPDTTLSPEAEVEAAYLAFWDMAVRLAGAPNPDEPEIVERASGEARDNLVNGLTTLRSAEQRSEFGQQYRHEVLSVQVDGQTAHIDDCAVDDSRVVDAATGEVVVEGVGTELLSATLISNGGDWLVDRFSQIESWEGVAECR
jgi:hypothetical protein